MTAGLGPVLRRWPRQGPLRYRAVERTFTATSQPPAWPVSADGRAAAALVPQNICGSWCWMYFGAYYLTLCPLNTWKQLHLTPFFFNKGHGASGLYCVIQERAMPLP